MPISRPMLASAVEDLGTVQYPVLASPKLDGIRCLIHPEHGVVSRKFKKIPNDHVRRQLEAANLWGLDGEILTWDEENHTYHDFNQIQSHVMSVEGEPTFMFMVFDKFTHDAGFADRLNQAATVIAVSGGKFAALVPHIQIDSAEDLLAQHLTWLGEGFEGSMIRSIDGPYKQGRSTVKQGWLLKYKTNEEGQAWEDAEGRVIGFEEKMTNTNTQEKDELGYAKRSHAKAGKVPASTLGALILHTDQWGEIRVGSGMDHTLQQEIWNNQHLYEERLVTFKYQLQGMKDKPRFPIFKGFRDPIDT